MKIVYMVKTQANLGRSLGIVKENFLEQQNIQDYI